ncbi:MAG: PD-(D/E)XK nuclease family protein, partial [Anaerolineae bacterium]|nr:PD-(D/E)XK nuclease family protein [Anaerolineae bacterium]
ALRWWRFPSKENGELRDVLESYAWKQGIIDEEQRRWAASEARDMLYRTMKSDVYRWVEDARQVYRELPFIFQYDDHIIHGVIDILFQRPDGSWVVVDYKTSFVPHQDAAALAEHARQFHLQVGVYAAAVREQLRSMTGADHFPATFIHYIRYHHTVEVPASDWQSALSQLENRIGALLGD